MERAAPIIVTAQFRQEDHGWLDGLRRAHFPPERNLIAAHLTMFHAVPPSAEAELRGRIKAATQGVAPPRAIVGGVMDLGQGTAMRIVSDGLIGIRAGLADGLHGVLTAQDAQGWRPHVTVQNKVSRAEARALQASLAGRFDGCEVAIVGLAAWAYAGGPWSPLFAARFG